MNTKSIGHYEALAIQEENTKLKSEILTLKIERDELKKKLIKALDNLGIYPPFNDPLLDS